MLDIRFRPFALIIVLVACAITGPTVSASPPIYQNGPGVRGEVLNVRGMSANDCAPRRTNLWDDLRDFFASFLSHSRTSERLSSRGAATSKKAVFLSPNGGTRIASNTVVLQWQGGRPPYHLIIKDAQDNSLFTDEIVINADTQNSDKTLCKGVNGTWRYLCMLPKAPDGGRV